MSNTLSRIIGRLLKDGADSESIAFYGKRSLERFAVNPKDLSWPVLDTKKAAARRAKDLLKWPS